jgi:two-component system, cell cycle response regulator DivK
MLLNGKFIFIVEDNPQNRLVFQMALNRQGAWLEFEPSGQDVMSHLLRLRTVDIIILDLMLPGALSGYDVFDQIRAHDQFAHVPIVAVTAADPAVALPRTREKGFNSFLIKPIDINLFPQQMARLLEGEEVWSMVSRS